MVIKKMWNKFLWCNCILNLLLLGLNLLVSVDPLVYMKWQKGILFLSVYACLTLMIFEIDSISITRQLSAHAVSVIPAIVLLFRQRIVSYELKNLILIGVVMFFLYTWAWFIMSVFWKSQAEELNGHITAGNRHGFGLLGMGLLYARKDEMKSARILVAEVTIALILTTLLYLYSYSL